MDHPSGQNRSGKNKAQARKDSGAEAESHRLTLDLSRAETLAAMLAHSRASQVVEVADLVAGMYLYDWDRLSKYWEYEDQERVEDLLRTICRISPERWNYWIQYYDKKRRGGEERFSFLPFLRKFQKEPAPETPPKHSEDLAAALKQAEAIAPFRDAAGGRNLPILTSECVLLCIVRSRQTEISRRLAATGMKVPELERDALSSRRARREE
jgi:hypothetical protein